MEDKSARQKFQRRYLGHTEAASAVTEAHAETRYFYSNIDFLFDLFKQAQLQLFIPDKCKEIFFQSI